MSPIQLNESAENDITGFGNDAEESDDEIPGLAFSFPTGNASGQEIRNEITKYRFFDNKM